MTDGMIEVVPQPRIDLEVSNFSDGLRWRRTEYSGTAWYGGRPSPASSGAMTMTRTARLDTPFFIPDSLPYQPDKLEESSLAVTIGVESLSDLVMIYDKLATFTLDPRDGKTSWVQIQIHAMARVPLALSYRVIAMTTLGAVQST